MLGTDTATDLVARVNVAWAAATAAVEQQLEKEGLGAAEALYAQTPGAAALAEGITRGSTREDFKLLLTAADAWAALGVGGVAGVLSELEAVRGAAPSAQPLNESVVVWALRRTEASGRWISFRELRVLLFSCRRASASRPPCAAKLQTTTLRA